LRKKFREFYNNDEIDFENLNNDVLIVFDTNILLNIYRYSSKTSNTFIKSINRVQNNIWIPYQVGMEFNLNRKKVMRDVKKAPSNFKDNFEGKTNDFMNWVKDDLGKYFLKSMDAKKIKEEILDDLTTQMNRMKDDIIGEKFEVLAKMVEPGEDRLMELIESLDNKVGDSFTQVEINEICDEGAHRFEKKIPPGYEDASRKKGFTYFNGLDSNRNMAI